MNFLRIVLCPFDVRTNRKHPVALRYAMPSRQDKIPLSKQLEECAKKITLSPLGTDRLWCRRGGGGRFWRGVQFSKRVYFRGGQFWKCTKCEGVEILRQRTGLLCESCQTILWLKQIHVSFKSRQKKYALAVLCQKQNVTRIKLGPETAAISSTRNVVCIYTHIACCKLSISVDKRNPAYAYNWNLEKYIDFFLFTEIIFNLKSG